MSLLRADRGLSGWIYGFLGRTGMPRSMDSLRQCFLPLIRDLAQAEPCVFRFPATLSPDGAFTPSGASPPRFLHINTPRNNTSCGYWAFPFGPEDPRLYWTDDRRPAMSLSVNARGPERCRSVGYIEDLRDVWEELTEAMRDLDPTLARPWISQRDAEWRGVKELRHQSMPNT